MQRKLLRNVRFLLKLIQTIQLRKTIFKIKLHKSEAYLERQQKDYNKRILSFKTKSFIAILSRIFLSKSLKLKMDTFLELKSYRKSASFHNNLIPAIIKFFEIQKLISNKVIVLKNHAMFKIRIHALNQKQSKGKIAKFTNVLTGITGIFQKRNVFNRLEQLEVKDKNQIYQDRVRILGVKLLYKQLMRIYVVPVFVKLKSNLAQRKRGKLQKRVKAKFLSKILQQIKRKQTQSLISTFHLLKSQPRTIFHQTKKKPFPSLYNLKRQQIFANSQKKGEQSRTFRNRYKEIRGHYNSGNYLQVKHAVKYYKTSRRNAATHRRFMNRSLESLNQMTSRSPPRLLRLNFF